MQSLPSWTLLFVAGSAWLVFSGGAKSILMAWLVQAALQPELAARACHLGTRTPPKCASAPCAQLRARVRCSSSALGPRHDFCNTCAYGLLLLRRGFSPKPNAAGETDAESDQRILALAAWQAPVQQQQQPPGIPPSSRAASEQALSCWVLVADSAAQLQLHTFQQGSGGFSMQAMLTYHSCPVLSLAQLLVEPAPQPAVLNEQQASGNSSAQDGSALGSACRLAFSGATDGSLAVWDVGSIAAGQQQQQQVVEPLLALPAWHQSGINALHAAVCTGGLCCACVHVHLVC